jgi:protein arginine kinase activator
MALYRLQKCSLCGEEEALIFVKLVTEEKVEEKGLCAHCAIKYMNGRDKIKSLQFIDRRVLDALEEMRSLLTAIVSNIQFISDVLGKDDKNQIKCPNCGMTYDDLKTNVFFGCPVCYQTFNDFLKDFILEVERGPVHKGRMPKKYIRLYLLKKEVNFLKNQLKKLVFQERYEEAVKTKKRLEKLLGSYPVGKEDEIY